MSNTKKVTNLIFNDTVLTSMPDIDMSDYLPLSGGNLTGDLSISNADIRVLSGNYVQTEEPSILKIYNSSNAFAKADGTVYGDPYVGTKGFYILSVYPDESAILISGDVRYSSVNDKHYATTRYGNTLGDVIKDHYILGDLTKSRLAGFSNRNYLKVPTMENLSQVALSDLLWSMSLMSMAYSQFGSVSSIQTIGTNTKLFFDSFPNFTPDELDEIRSTSGKYIQEITAYGKQGDNLLYVPGFPEIGNAEPIQLNGQSIAGGSPKAIGRYAHAEGREALADMRYSHAEGTMTIAGGIASHAEGQETIARGSQAHSEGLNTEAFGFASHSEGVFTKAPFKASHAEGNYTLAGNSYAHAENAQTSAVGVASHAEGIVSKANSFGSHAEGNGSVANKAGAHAEGGNFTYDDSAFNSTSAMGTASHAEGLATYANGDASHAEGLSTLAYGHYSHAEGANTSAYNQYSHAEGISSYAYGNYSHAQNYQTSAYGEYSHAEGVRSYAKGDCSHAEGVDTIAEHVAHAEGTQTSAFGSYSHAEGEQTYVSTDGRAAHVEGIAVSAMARCTHAGGCFAAAKDKFSYIWNGDEAVHVSSNGIGTFNVNPVGGIDGFYISNKKLSEYLSQSNVLYGKKLVVFGDSFSTTLTSNTTAEKIYPYCNLIADRNNMALRNYSSSGAGMTNINKSAGFSLGRYFATPSELATISADIADADYILIQYGLNDGATDYAIGVWSPDDKNTNATTSPTNYLNTVWGSWNTALSGMLNLNPTAKIGMIIPDSWMNQTGDGTYGTNNYNYKHVYEKMKEIAVWWGIPCLDMKEDPNVTAMLGQRTNCNPYVTQIRHAAFEATSDFAIPGHPNQIGQSFRSIIIENFMRSL